MTRLYYIDASEFISRESAHRSMQRTFFQMEYYGSNLDALMDVLTSLRFDSEIRVLHFSVARREIPLYAEKIENVFRAAAESNPHLHFLFS